MPISSVSNPLIRRARRLRKRAWRERRAQVLVEGARAVTAALAAPGGLLELFHTARATRTRAALLEEVRGAGGTVKEVSAEVMAHLTSATTGPDVLGVAPLVETTLEGLRGRAVVLAPVRDPATAGAIMACAAAAGIDAAVFARGSSDAFAPKTIRAAQGAHFALAVVRDVDAGEALARVSAAEAATVTLSADGTPPWAGDLTGARAFVFTDASDGVAVPGRAVGVPRQGQIEPSLTAQAAAVLYEWVRQRSG